MFPSSHRLNLHNILYFFQFDQANVSFTQPARHSSFHASATSDLSPKQSSVKQMSAAPRQSTASCQIEKQEQVCGQEDTQELEHTLQTESLVLSFVRSCLILLDLCPAHDSRQTTHSSKAQVNSIRRQVSLTAVCVEEGRACQ